MHPAQAPSTKPSSEAILDTFSVTALSPTGRAQEQAQRDELRTASLMYFQV